MIFHFVNKRIFGDKYTNASFFKKISLISILILTMFVCPRVTEKNDFKATGDVCRCL